ncbi:MAG: hypothetical protein LBN74_03515, partial [Prevotella sp.]|nr:hypothetical protein [Prevotella sp.]
VGYLISNTSFLGMYIIEVLMWTFMIYAAYFTAKLYLDKVYAFIVALIFPLFVLSHSLEGGSAEEFIIVFESISLLLFLIYFKDKNGSTHRPVYMLIHGVLCAAALLIKINLIVFWFFPLLAIFINILKHKEYKNFIRNIIAYIVGLLILILPVSIYFIYNNALSDAWNTYITLNANYAKLGDISQIIENLTVRFYQRLRFEPFEYLVILTGVFYFPIKYIKNPLEKIALIISFIALHIVIFMSPNYVFYYSIPYYIFSLLGCVVIFDIIGKFLKLQAKWHFYILFLILALAIGVKEKSFFGTSKAEIRREQKPDNLVFQFSDIITKEKNPTLLNLSLDLGNGVFTMANIIPNVKYFISPNLPHSIYPDMRDEQTKYIENKEVQFIILSEFSFNFDYFYNLPALNENYEIIDTYIEYATKTYYLYKRKD